MFRDRYKTQPIYSERHLLCCIDYIHNNPIKAQICENPAEYQYSSYNYNLFMGNSEIERKIKIYIEERKKNKYYDEEFVLLEDDEDPRDNKDVDIQEAENYLKRNNITKELLKKDKELLEKIVKRLKDNNNLSLRKISEILGIGREKIRLIFLKNN